MPIAQAGTFIAFGLIYMLLGIICLAVPQVAAVSVALLCGLTLCLAGLLAASHWRLTRGWPGSGASLASALLLGGFGLILLLMPQAGVLTAGLLLAVFFLFDGIAKILVAMAARGIPGWRWLAFNGGISLLLAIMVFARFPVSATWILALVLGIHLLLKGWAYLMLGILARSVQDAGPQAPFQL